MGRYTGPKTRISRRYGVQIFGPSKSLERKNYPPGMHGPKGSRRKQSEYAIALGEKQKLRYQYGLLERQFRRIFQHALRKRGVTGETLLQLLETRLDNVIYRLGLATSRPQARQLVRHGHFLVNGKKVDVPSYSVRVSDVIGVRESSRNTPSIQHAIEEVKGRGIPEWLSFDANGLTGKVSSLPTREQINLPVQEQLIVELYSK